MWLTLGKQKMAPSIIETAPTMGGSIQRKPIGEGKLANDIRLAAFFDISDSRWGSELLLIGSNEHQPRYLPIWALLRF
jgi:hypothetical protein